MCKRHGKPVTADASIFRKGCIFGMKEALQIGGSQSGKAQVLLQSDPSICTAISHALCPKVGNASGYGDEAYFTSTWKQKNRGQSNSHP